MNVDNYLTDEERADLQRIFDGSKARDYERDVLAPRRAAEEAERQRQAAADADRKREYARAADAALLWRPGWKTLPPDIERLQHHVIDVLMTEPVIKIHWLKPNTRSEALMRTARGTAIKALSPRGVTEPTIVTEAIVDGDTANTALHERGHHVTPQRGSKLHKECEAWRFAREHALAWDAAAQAGMVASLKTYLDSADRSDILGVLEVERLCSTVEYYSERQRRLELQLREDEARLEDEQAKLKARLNGRSCERCRKRVATRVYAQQPSCQPCAEAMRQRQEDEELEKKLRRLRAEMNSRRGRQ